MSNILNQVKPGDALVSFNYDTLVESLCVKRNGLMVRHSAAPVANIVRFSKPHGSASWNRRNLIGDTIDGPPLLTSLDEDEAKSNTVDPLLLGAVPIKSELIREVQHWFNVGRVYDVIYRQWQAVADAVWDADRLVILGYSFPPEDTYGRFFFGEAMRERPPGQALQVEYYEKEERKKKAECLIRAAIPNTKARLQRRQSRTPGL